MSTVAAYALIRPAVVAVLADNKVPENGVLPPIIGSGFAVGDNGLIATAGHVVDAAFEADRTPGLEPSVAFFVEADMGGGQAVNLMLGKPIIRSISFSHEPGQPAPDHAVSDSTPDLGLLQIAMTGLPLARLDPDPRLVEGLAVGVAGFPLGTDLLQRLGGVGHLTPTLRTGVVSARLMGPEGVRNSGFLFDVLNQAGSSGSPVFDDDGVVVGIHVAARPDPTHAVIDIARGRPTPVAGHSGLSIAVSSRFLSRRLASPLELSPVTDDWASWPTLLRRTLERAQEGMPPGSVLTVRGKGDTLEPLEEGGAIPDVSEPTEKAAD